MTRVPLPFLVNIFLNLHRLVEEQNSPETKGL